MTFPPWSIYAAVTNLFGQHGFKLELHATDSGKVIIPIEGKIDSRDANDVIELTFHIGGAPFPEPGRYQLNFSIDGEPVGFRTLFVEKSRETSPEKR